MQVVEKQNNRRQSKWKNLIGAECLYSIRYLDDRTFSIRKCQITENIMHY